MELKDWILLIVPILCNGVIVFILQQIFEKKQKTREIKLEYAAELRQKIDKALSLHADALLLSQSRNSDMQALSKLLSNFIDESSIVHFYFNENRTVLYRLNNIMEKLVEDIQKVLAYINIKPEKYLDKTFLSLIQNIHDTLLTAKEKCIKI